MELVVVVKNVWSINLFGPNLGFNFLESHRNRFVLTLGDRNNVLSDFVSELFLLLF